MIDISQKSGHKYFLFGSLYFAEGLQQSLAMVIIPIYLVDKGFSLPLAMGWPVGWLWSPGA